MAKKVTQSIGKIDFTQIGFKSSLRKATKIRKQIIQFFKDSPDGELQLHFGGYARLSGKFSDEVFKKLVTDPKFDWKKYGNSITNYGMHIFDGQNIAESIKEGSEIMGY